MIDALIGILRRAYIDQPQVPRAVAELCRFRTLDPAICQTLLDVVLAQRGSMLVDGEYVISQGALASRSVRSWTLRVKPDRRRTIVPVSFDRRVA